MILDIFIALLLGAVAGAIDALPMLRMKVPKVSVLYVFAQWVFIGLVIPFVSWAIPPWLKGLIIGELGMVPVMILTYYRNKTRVPGIIVFGALLGIGLGIAGGWLIG